MMLMLIIINANDEADDADANVDADTDSSYHQILSRHQIPCNGSVFLLDC